MNQNRRKPSVPYYAFLTRSERQRFAEYSRAPLDHEIALLRLFNERRMIQLSETSDPEEHERLEHKIAQTAVLIARLMLIRIRTGQNSTDDRLAEIAAGLRSAFTRAEPPNRIG